MVKLCQNFLCLCLASLYIFPYYILGWHQWCHCLLKLCHYLHHFVHFVHQLHHFGSHFFIRLGSIYHFPYLCHYKCWNVSFWGLFVIFYFANGIIHVELFFILTSELCHLKIQIVPFFMPNYTIILKSDVLMNLLIWPKICWWKSL